MPDTATIAAPGVGGIPVGARGTGILRLARCMGHSLEPQRPARYPAPLPLL